MTDLAKKAKAQQWKDFTGPTNISGNLVKNAKKIMLLANEDDDTPFSILTVIYDPVNGQFATLGNIPQALGGATGITLKSPGLNVNSVLDLFNGTNYDLAFNSHNLYANADTTLTSVASGTLLMGNLVSAVIQFNVSAFVGTSWTPEIDFVDGQGNTQKWWVKGTAMTAAANVTLFFGAFNTFSALGANTGLLGQTQTEAATGNQTFVNPVPLPRQIKLVVNKSAATTFTSNLVVDAVV